MKHITLFAFTCLSCAVLAAPIAAHAADASRTTRTFIKDAVIGNTFEVDAGNIVVKKTKNNDVKNFAQRMVTDHSQAGNTLNDELKAQNLADKAPSKLDSEHKKIIDRFNNETGPKLDKDYIATMKKDHDDDVAKFQKYADSGDNDALKSYAAQTLPTLQEHQKIVTDLAKTVDSGKTASTTTSPRKTAHAVKHHRVTASNHAKASTYNSMEPAAGLPIENPARAVRKDDDDSGRWNFLHGLTHDNDSDRNADETSGSR